MDDNANSSDKAKENSTAEANEKNTDMDIWNNCIINLLIKMILIIYYRSNEDDNK
jgi:hypothetical protein